MKKPTLEDTFAHDWEAVDSQGYSQECSLCGAYSSVYADEVSPETEDGQCPEKKRQTEEKHKRGVQ